MRLIQNKDRMKKYIIVFILIITFCKISAQQSPDFAYTYLNPGLINPAYVGQTDYFKGTLMYCNLMAGVNYSPQTAVFNLESPVFNKKAGLGMLLCSDSENILGHLSLKGTYSYNLQLGENQYVLMGFSFGFMQNHILYDRIIAENPEEVLNLYNMKSSNVFNTDLGAAYTYKNFEAGVSVLNLFKIVNNSNDYEIPYQSTSEITFNAKYKYKINDEYSLLPSVIFRSPMGVQPSYGVSVIAQMREMIWGGLSYGDNQALGILLGLNYRELSFGYYYAYPIGTALNKVSNGSHEIYLSFRIKKIRK